MRSPDSSAAVAVPVQPVVGGGHRGLLVMVESARLRGHLARGARAAGRRRGSARVCTGARRYQAAAAPAVLSAAAAIAALVAIATHI